MAAKKKPAKKATGRKRGPGQKYTEQERVDQRQRAIRMWMSSATYPQIAERLNISLSTAYGRVQEAIDEMRPHGDFDKYRAVQIVEIEMMRRVLRKDVMRYDTGSISRSDGLAVIDKFLKLQEREAKLLGLDRAPHVFDEIASMSDQQIAELLDEWRDEFESEEELR